MIRSVVLLSPLLIAALVFPAVRGPSSSEHCQTEMLAAATRISARDGRCPECEARSLPANLTLPDKRSISTRIHHVWIVTTRGIVPPAELFGGPKAARGLLDFLSCLQNRASSEKQIRKELCWIRSLLALEFVDNLESEEASCFAMIDPASDVVSDLCILHDQLDELLETTDADIGVKHS